MKKLIILPIILVSLFLWQMETGTKQAFQESVSEAYELTPTEFAVQSLLEKAEFATKENTMKKCQRYTGTEGRAWCASFVVYLVNQVADEYGLGAILPKTASTQGLYRWAVRKKCLKEFPRIGDIALWQHKIFRNGGHTGIVMDVHKDGRFVTIDGNVQPDKRNIPDNGNVKVMYKNLYEDYPTLELQGFIDIRKLFNHYLK